MSNRLTPSAAVRWCIAILIIVVFFIALFAALFAAGMAIAASLKGVSFQDIWYIIINGIRAISQ